MPNKQKSIFMVKEDTTFENNLIKIGENKEENDQLVAKAKQADLWFHLANLPSCHVIMNCTKKSPATKEMIEYCAKLVKENTKYKNHNKLKVHYTTIKNVKRTDTPGKVILKGKINSITI